MSTGLPDGYTEVPATDPEPPMAYTVVPATDGDGLPLHGAEKAAATRAAKSAAPTPAGVAGGSKSGPSGAADTKEN